MASVRILIEGLVALQRRVPWMIPVAAAALVALLAIPRTREMMCRALNRATVVLANMCRSAATEFGIAVGPIVIDGEQAGRRLQKDVISHARLNGLRTMSGEYL